MLSISPTFFSKLCFTVLYWFMAMKMVALGMSFSKLFAVELSLLNYEFLTSSLLTTYLNFFKSRGTVCNFSRSKSFTFRPNKSCVYLNIEPINPVFLKTYHCVKSVRIRSYSGLHFSRIFPHSDWIQRIQCISPYSVRMWENVGKIQTEISPNTESFQAVYTTGFDYIITAFADQNGGLLEIEDKA